MATLPSAEFPNLSPQNHEDTSPEDSTYNCIAWAAQDVTRWWWPDPTGGYYWPPGLPKVETVENFRRAYKLLGYEVCDSGHFEAGYEKVAIYADTSGVPTHAARQLTGGLWTSKLGRLEDIVHDDVTVVEGPCYGTVVMFLRRFSSEE